MCGHLGGGGDDNGDNSSNVTQHGLPWDSGLRDCQEFLLRYLI